ncbi:MAG: acyl-CoA thioester hydrolase/BAAT C-terminal domain-containing protein [Aerococcus sp.]|nr:acyl-CoA thioester hydrolase/BAAT C-terminal domain-containing protein [Aerococcus sp.]
MYTIRELMINQLPVMEYAPTDQLNDAVPLVFFYHGWECVPEQCATQALEFVKQGFRVVVPVSYGHGVRTSPDVMPSPLIFFEALQHNVAEFPLIVAGYRERGLLNDFIGVSGLSMGGITTSMLLATYPEISAASSLEGATSIVNFSKWFYQMALENPEEALAQGIDESMAKMLEELLPQLDAVDLSSHPERLANRPFLLWHAMDDPIVPYEIDRAFFDANATQSYGEYLHFISSPAGGHHVPYHASYREAAFFKACLTEDGDQAIWEKTEQAMAEYFGSNRQERGGYDVIG